MNRREAHAHYEVGKGGCKSAVESTATHKSTNHGTGLLTKASALEAGTRSRVVCEHWLTLNWVVVVEYTDSSRTYSGLSLLEITHETFP